MKLFQLFLKILIYFASSLPIPGNSSHLSTTYSAAKRTRACLRFFVRGHHVQVRVVFWEAPVLVLVHVLSMLLQAKWRNKHQDQKEEAGQVKPEARKNLLISRDQPDDDLTSICLKRKLSCHLKLSHASLFLSHLSNKSSHLDHLINFIIGFSSPRQFVNSINDSGPGTEIEDEVPQSIKPLSECQPNIAVRPQLC